jgi:hypothetical protein
MFTSGHRCQSDHQLQPSSVPHSPRAPQTSQHSSNPIWQHLAMCAQTKEAIGGPANVQELEADRAAEQAMGSSSGAVSYSLARSGDAGKSAGGGQPIPDATRLFFESRFGHDFSGVRLHTDHAAHEAAQTVGARAFAVGSDVGFDHRGFSPQRFEDHHLLAHELAHVVQQRQAGTRSPGPTDQSDPVTAQPPAEQAADAAATAIASGERAPAQPSQPVQVGRQLPYQPYPAPMPGALPRQPAAPPTPAPVEKKKIEEPPPAPEEKKTTKKRAPVGSSGSFKGSPTAALLKWDYVVYENEVRLGNRKVDETPGGPVIGGWPWMTNNPGDLTGDVSARKEEPNKEDSAYRQDKRIWGEATQRGKDPQHMSDVAGSSGLSADNAAVKGFAARGDLAIFADPERGRRALKEWIEKYYKDVTLKESVKLHLGVVVATQYKGTAHVDDPDKYPKLLQEYLSDKGFPSDYVSKTKGSDIKAEEWNNVINAFGYAEGFYARRPVAGQKGKFQYIENKGIVYRCAGRDAVDVDPAYRDLSRVKSLPQDTPPEIKDLLGCD